MSLITKPSKYPVTKAETKKFCDIDHDDHDLIIERLIAAATSHVEKITASSLVRRQYRLYLDAFCEAALPLGPVKSIQQIQYVDANGDTQTLSTTVYELSPKEDKVLLSYGQSWPGVRYQDNAVWLDYWAGYFDDSVSPIKLTDEIPDELKVAIMFMVRDLYDNPSKQQDVQLYENAAFDAMVSPYRSYVA